MPACVAKKTGLSTASPIAGSAETRDVMLDGKGLKTLGEVIRARRSCRGTNRWKRQVNGPRGNRTNWTPRRPLDFAANRRRAARMPPLIRSAAPADLPLILEFIRALAVYEKLAHEVEATEAKLHDTL